MPNERARDIVEETAAAFLEAATSMVPIVGGPMAVALNRALGSAVQRRNERILAGIRSDLDDLIANDQLQEPEAIFASEHFLAALHTVVAASQQTASEEKRLLLRHALINGMMGHGYDEAQQFTQLMARYDPEHVAVLTFVEDHMKDAELRLPRVKHDVFARLYPDGDGHFGDYLRTFGVLVQDGLITEVVTHEVKTENIATGNVARAKETMVARPREVHDISTRGSAFLKFVARPASLM